MSDKGNDNIANVALVVWSPPASILVLVPTSSSSSSWATLSPLTPAAGRATLPRREPVKPERRPRGLKNRGHAAPRRPTTARGGGGGDRQRVNARGQPGRTSSYSALDCRPSRAGGDAATSDPGTAFQRMTARARPRVKRTDSWMTCPGS